jgi:phosphate starvation-inducible PhoH-like protein
LTIVLEDRNFLGQLCGANDENLRVFEEILGARVLTRGNELTIESGNEETNERFREMIEHLVEYAQTGHLPGPDLIRAVAGSLNNQSDQTLLKENFINIPGSGKIFPRGIHQAYYINGMSTKDIAFGVGPAGTGKTFLAVAHALQEVLGKKQKKLILTRPVVEAGESLGYLPGDLVQKINPYLRPLYDAMDALIPCEMINKLEENRIIEIAPLAYMRGRNLANCYIILDEAQNTTREQMKMFLTRIGENSKAVITGDITQIDLPSSRKSGLLHVAKILKHIKDIHFSFSHILLG